MRFGSFIARLAGCAPLTPYEDAIATLPKEHFLTLRGRKIFVEERGSGPPLLLLHGFAASSYSCPTLNLAGVKVPTLVMAGRHDRIVPLENGQRLVAALPDARLVILEDSGHSAPEEEPETVAKTLRGFAARPGPNP
jgi:pimeloyl-ACP methyl ester carboxylesterase